MDTTKAMTETIGKKNEDHIANTQITAAVIRERDHMIVNSNIENKRHTISQTNKPGLVCKIEL